MAHELMLDEKGKALMFYVKDVPWHGLGTALGKPPTAAEAIRAAKLDWEVIKTPLFHLPSLEATEALMDRYALIPGKGWPEGKPRPVFGIATGRYTALQNREAFSFFDPMIRRGYATYETAGALGKGERVWVLAKLSGDMEVGTGDRVQRYVLLSNRHDGHGAVRILFTPVRVVCQNTLSMAMQDGRRIGSARHDGSLMPSLEMAAEEMMELIEVRYREIHEACKKLLKRKLAEADLRAYLAEIFPEPVKPEDVRMADRWKNARELALWSRAGSTRLYRTSPHCRMAGSTGWAAYNAVTEFVDHCRPANSPGRAPAAQLNRIWFGSGAQIKFRAFELAMRHFTN